MAPSTVITSMVLLMQAHGVVSQSHLALLQYRVNVSAASDGDTEVADAGEFGGRGQARTPLQEFREEQRHPGGKAALLSIASHTVAGAAHRQQATQIGCTAPITEEGYQQVAATRRDGEMASFIRRVLASHDYVSMDQPALNGLVPFYSGARAAQSLDALWEDLRKKTWVLYNPLGNRAPLTEEGYQAVAALKKDDEMKVFAHRLLHDRGFRADDDAALTGLVPYHSGTWATQSMEALLADLYKKSWVVYKPGIYAPLTEDGYKAVVRAHNDESMSYFVNRLLAASGHIAYDEPALAGLLPYYSGTRSVQSLDALLADLGKKIWVIPDPNGSGGFREADGKLFVSQC